VLNCHLRFIHQALLPFSYVWCWGILEHPPLGQMRRVGECNRPRRCAIRFTAFKCEADMGSTLGTSSYVESAPPSHIADSRWELVRRVAGSRQFAKAPLLSKFLIYVCDRTLEGKQTKISEYQIGVEVFGRPAGYSPSEDNIVRNYARQLRKRLAEHFATDGCDEILRIEIPLGGYVPVFVPQSEAAAPSSAGHPNDLSMPVIHPVPSLKPTNAVWSWRRTLPIFLLSVAGGPCCTSNFAHRRSKGHIWADSHPVVATVQR